VAIGRTTADLVASIRRRCFMKPADPDFSTVDLIGMLNEQVGSYLYDLMRPYAQNYAVQTSDQPLISGQQTYAIPDRAVNGTLEAMGIVDPTGRSPGYRLQLLDLQDSVLMQRVASSVVPVAYSLESNVVRVWPTPGAATAAQNTLRIQYMQRASELVDVAAVCVTTGALSNVTPTSYRVLVGAVPATFTAGARVELVDASPGYSTFAPSGVISATGGGFVDVTGVAPVAPQTVTAGDYLCLFDQAPVLTNVPLEFQECLLQWVALKCLEGKGDQAGMDRLGATLRVSEANIRRQLTQRNTGARRFLSAWAGFAGTPVRGQLWPLAQPGP
jgi:hypothetical protein